MRCFTCMAVNPPGNRYCGACGAMLDAARQTEKQPPAADSFSRWGELKQATILFADIVSSTEHIANLDPEQAMDRLQPALQRMCDAVESFGGTVVRTMGDGIMAMFGVPLSLEGHARLACEAALTMQKAFTEVRQGWRIRVGLHSGQVAWDPVNSDGVRGGGVHGLTIHLASRVMAAAEPGGIWITQDCFDLARADCDAIPLGSHSMKGIPAPVPVYRLMALKPPAPIQYVDQGNLTSFRGRDQELSALQNALRQAAIGNAQVVGISGEPGTGKSRICFEFAQECRDGQIPVFEVRTQLYGRATPLQPVLELLRIFFFGISAVDDSSAARARITQRLAELGMASVDDEALLFEFLGLVRTSDNPSQLSPKGRHLRLLALVRELCERRAATLAVLVMEDLHWLDEASEEFVEALVNAVAGTRTLLVLNYRPLYRPPWGKANHFRRVDLGELSVTETDAMVRELMGFRPELKDICELVVRRSGGNPFFAEELVRSLAESGMLAVDEGLPDNHLEMIERALPSTVQAVVAARIDHLGELEKTLLQMCAIIGKEIPLAVLARVAGARTAADIERGLAGLHHAALIQPLPAAEGGLYAFRHPLIQEVAYSTQLKARRGPIHSAVAVAMEAYYLERLDEFAALIAYHYDAAGRSVDAAGYESRAARWIGVTDSAQAIKHWFRVRSLLQEEPRTAKTDSMRAIAGGQIGILGWRQGLTLTEVQPIIQEAVSLAGAADGRLIQLLHIVEGRMVVSCGGASDDYIGLALRALSLGSPDDIGRTATINTFLSQAYGWAGLLNEALAANDAALAAVDRIDRFDRDFIGFSIEHWLLGMRSRLLIRMGRLDEARHNLESMLATDKESLDPAVLIIAHYGYVDLAGALQESELAHTHAAAAMSLADRHGLQYVRVLALGSSAAARSLSGDHAAALRLFEESLMLIRNANTALEFESEVLAGLADCYFRTGEFARAVSVSQEAIKLSRARGTRLPECRALIVHGASQLAQFGLGASSAAENSFRLAEALIAKTGATIFEGQLRRERAKLAQAAEL